MSAVAAHLLAVCMAFLATFLAARAVIASEDSRRLRDTAAVLRGGTGRRRSVRKRRALTPRQRQRLEEQLESLVVLVGGGMAAGQNVTQAVESCAGEIDGEPLGPELTRALDEYRVGTPFIASLWAMASRLGHPDADYLVRVMEVQTLTGGEFAGALDSVASTIRARRQLRGEVRAGCAEARLSAVIMAVLPPLMALFAMSVKPEMLRAMTGTPAGRVGLAYGIASWLAGAYVCRFVSAVPDA